MGLFIKQNGQLTQVGSGTRAGTENPMTNTGDLIVGGASGTPTRLGIGTNGQVLTSNGTTASWENASSGGGTQLYKHKVVINDGSSNTTFNLVSGNSNQITTVSQFKTACNGNFFRPLRGTSSPIYCVDYSNNVISYAEIEVTNSTYAFSPKTITAVSITDTVTAL